MFDKQEAQPRMKKKIIIKKEMIGWSQNKWIFNFILFFITFYAGKQHGEQRQN